MTEQEREIWKAEQEDGTGERIPNGTLRRATLDSTTALARKNGIKEFTYQGIRVVVGDGGKAEKAVQ